MKNRTQQKNYLTQTVSSKNFIHFIFSIQDVWYAINICEIMQRKKNVTPSQERNNQYRQAHRYP